MNKVYDKKISDAWQRGFDDFWLNGPDTHCPFAKETEEFPYWVMGFEDAFDDYRKHPDDLEII